ncbi:MAG: CCA tRNA nucleotidyltransferase [Bdellovibrionaceae bacterium]|nr:CCA tRNA nucleotidyltransferase [Pseudobdellovibrionaceae bacterium]
MTSVLEILQGHPDWAATLGVLQCLQRSGHRALLAGGCVRDALRGVTAQDLDVATSATPDQVISLFVKTVEVGKSFGVVRVLEKGADLEVATFRKDSSSGDGRRPDSIEFSDEKNDALRRDFTVNALFFDPVSNEVLDYVEGLKDLRGACLRTVGEPQRRFQEDRLRILRAVRFAVQLDFEIEAVTWAEIRRSVRDVLSVSQERIRDELFKLLKFGQGKRAWGLMNRSDLWGTLFPELSPLEASEAADLQRLISVPTDNRVEAFSRLFAVWGMTPLTESVIDRLRLGKNEEKSLKTRLRWAFDLSSIWMLSRGERVLTYDDPDVRAGMDLWEERRGASEERDLLHQEWAALTVEGKLPAPFLTGDDLKAVLQGPLIGQVLREAYRRQLEGELTSRDAALTWFSGWSKLNGGK